MTALQDTAQHTLAECKEKHHVLARHIGSDLSPLAIVSVMLERGEK